MMSHSFAQKSNVESYIHRITDFLGPPPLPWESYSTENNTIHNYAEMYNSLNLNSGPPLYSDVGHMYTVQLGMLQLLRSFVLLLELWLWMHITIMSLFRAQVGLVVLLIPFGFLCENLYHVLRFKLQ
ncbi:hypothetical protein VNO77_33825 [Canavalia gladiata]|uniref:Uncharacterized protein n=1 Tax=Canavalia gladiata TaxID=3824 RepID=A0AAN9KEI5_CANGL